jgi:CBS domain-containing protein
MKLDEDKEDERRWLEGDTKRVFDEHVLDHPIRTIGLRPSVTLPEGAMLSEAIRLMRERKIGSALVTREGRLVGIVTERDLLMRAAMGEFDPAKTHLDQLMHVDPVVLTPEHPIAYAINLMSDGGFRHIPLVDAEKRPVGIISIRDIVDYFAWFFREKVLNLPPTPDPPAAQSREGG